MFSLSPGMKPLRECRGLYCFFPLVVLALLRYYPSYLTANLRKPPKSSSICDTFSEELCQIGN
jgi:hypothetical protein